MKYTICSLEEMDAFVAQLLPRGLTPGKERATVVGLYGDLGAGKTAFVKSLAQELGVPHHVTSPTFVIMKLYPLLGHVFETLVHIDAYRLEKGEELSQLGWEKLLANPKNLICIEWPERVAEVMPAHRKLLFTFVDEKTREIVVELNS